MRTCPAELLYKISYKIYMKTSAFIAFLYVSGSLRSEQEGCIFMCSEVVKLAVQRVDVLYKTTLRKLSTGYPKLHSCGCCAKKLGSLYGLQSELLVLSTPIGGATSALAARELFLHDDISFFLRLWVTKVRNSIDVWYEFQ